MDGVGKAHIYTQPNQCSAQGTAIVYPDKKKAPVISHKGFIRLDFWLLDLGSNQGPTD